MSLWQPTAQDRRIASIELCEVGDLNCLHQAMEAQGTYNGDSLLEKWQKFSAK